MYMLKVREFFFSKTHTWSAKKKKKQFLSLNQQSFKITPTHLSYNINIMGIWISCFLILKTLYFISYIILYTRTRRLSNIARIIYNQPEAKLEQNPGLPELFFIREIYWNSILSTNYFNIFCW